MQITIKTIFGYTFELHDVYPESTTVREICDKVRSHFDINFEKVALIYAGKDLMYERTLAEYQIIEYYGEVAIHAVFKYTPEQRQEMIDRGYLQE